MVSTSGSITSSTLFQVLQHSYYTVVDASCFQWTPSNNAPPPTRACTHTKYGPTITSSCGSPSFIEEPAKSTSPPPRSIVLPPTSPPRYHAPLSNTTLLLQWQLLTEAQEAVHQLRETNYSREKRLQLELFAPLRHRRANEGPIKVALYLYICEDSRAIHDRSTTSWLQSVTALLAPIRRFLKQDYCQVSLNCTDPFNSLR